MNRPSVLPLESAGGYTSPSRSPPARGLSSDSTFVSISVYDNEKSSSFHGGGTSYLPLAKPKRSALRRFWDRRVRGKTVPRLIYTISGFVLMALWVGIIFSFANRETKLQRTNANGDANKLSSLANSITGQSGGAQQGVHLLLQGNLVQFDADAREMTVEWSAVALANNSIQPLTSELLNGMPIGFYRDVTAPLNQTATQLVLQETEQLGLNPFNIYSLDNNTAPRLAILGVHPWDSVDTDIDMAASASDDVWKQPLFGYPWDEWSGSITIVTTFETAIFYNNFVAQGGTLNDLGVELVELQAVTVQVEGVSLTGNILNWKIEQSNQPSVTCDNTNVDATDMSCQIEVTFTARRPGLVIFIVLIVIIVNWLSTIAIFLITGEAILLRRLHILSGTDILAMCFAALFALPTVRSLLPGAPSQFGAVIDLIGILPNVIIVSLCTTCFAMWKIRMRIQQAKELEAA